MIYRLRDKMSARKFKAIFVVVLGLAMIGGPPAYGTEDEAIADQRANEKCCVVIGIDRHRSVVTALDKRRAHWFQFVVRQRHLLGTVRPGQILSANFGDSEVSDVPACADTPCRIALSGRRQQSVTHAQSSHE